MDMKLDYLAKAVYPKVSKLLYKVTEERYKVKSMWDILDRVSAYFNSMFPPAELRRLESASQSNLTSVQSNSALDVSIGDKPDKKSNQDSSYSSYFSSYKTYAKAAAAALKQKTKLAYRELAIYTRKLAGKLKLDSNTEPYNSPEAPVKPRDFPQTK